MNTINSLDNWQISINYPEMLQFAAFVGKKEGFSVETSKNNDDIIQQEWKQWWDFLQEQDSNPSLLTSLLFELENRKLIWKLFQNYSADFQKEFRGNQLQKSKIILNAINLLHTDENLKKYLKTDDLNKSNFYLSLDFVHWPEFYKRKVSNDHLILGLGFLDTDFYDEFVLLLAKQLIDLIKISS